MLFYHLFIALEFDIYLIIKYMAVLIVQMSFGAAHYFTMCRRNILACSVIDLFLLKFMFVCHCSLEFVCHFPMGLGHTQIQMLHTRASTHKSKCHTHKFIACLEFVCAPLSWCGIRVTLSYETLPFQYCSCPLYSIHFLNASVHVVNLWKAGGLCWWFQNWSMRWSFFQNQSRLGRYE